MDSMFTFGVILAVAFLLYMLPAIIAHHLCRKDENAITVLNLFLGWTFIGWVACMIWAVLPEKR